MTKLDNKWMIAELIPQEINQALSELPQGLRQLLYNRGIYSKPEADDFLNLSGSIHDPFLLNGMEAAVDRITDAIKKDEAIVVYGDYDVDGISATALLFLFLKAYGAKVSAYIPNRFEEGYGLNDKALLDIAKNGTKLVITVDCGIRSVREVEAAAQNGLDIIISDHHQAGSTLPPAVTIINPKLPGDQYPDRNLPGVGLAYKIAQAVYNTHPKNEVTIESFLDLVALGTVADIVPLTGENRALVKAGLNQLRTGNHIGISALAGAAGINIHNLNASDIGFMLGPRLNAAGRLSTARAALDLLTTTDYQQAGLLAQKLDDLNRERQNMVKNFVTVARKQKEEEQQENLIVSFQPEYHQGVVGLVASRLAEENYRPAIIGQIKKDYVVASCRSIPEFHITHALDQCADLLSKHGGHEMAAGFTLPVKNQVEFLSRMIEITETMLSGLELAPTLKADIEIPLRQIPNNILSALENLEPTGQSNPQVVFISRKVKIVHKRTVGDGQHLSMKVKDGNKVYPAIAFRKGDLISTIPDQIDLMYNIMRNEYNGYVSTQLNIKDIKSNG